MRIITVRGAFAPRSDTWLLADVLCGQASLAVRYDIVVSNPPYLPAGPQRPPTRGAARAWEGGSDGRALLDRICAGVAQHLRPGGTVLLMQSSVNGLQRTLDARERGGLRADVVATRRGPLGPLLRARAGALRAGGLLDADGPLEEALHVVRGRRVERV